MSTTFSGSLKDLGVNVVSQNATIRFYLRGTGGNQPRVDGVALIPPTIGNVYYKEFTPDASGNVSGTLYSTRDAAGTGNGEIEVGGSFTACWYGLVLFLNGREGPETPIHAKNGVALNLTSVTPLTTNPVVTAPTGDTTYARLDGGNMPFGGTVQAPNEIINSTGVIEWGSSAYTTPDTGLSRDSAGVIDVGNGTAGDVSGTVKATILALVSAGILKWSTDTGISRLGAHSLAFGNGTQGDVSASVSEGPVTINFSTALNNAITMIDAAGPVTWDIGPQSVQAFELRRTNNPLLIVNNSPAQLVLPSTGVIGCSSTSSAASGVDTAISRTSANVLAVGNGTQGDASGTLKVTALNNGGTLSLPTSTDTLVGRATTDTLTSKRVTPRQVAVSDATSITPNSDTSDIVTQTNTQAGGTLTINAPTGTPTDGQKLIIRIKASNNQTYSFNATYHFSTSVIAPTTLAAGKTDYIGVAWNATNSAWDVLAVDQGH